MAYDQDLANRVRELLRTQAGLTEKAMFGGLGFMINGNMAVAASGQGGLLVRCDRAETEALTNGSHVERFSMRGRGVDWLHIDEEAISSSPELERWAGIGISYANALPPKR